MYIHIGGTCVCGSKIHEEAVSEGKIVHIVRVLVPPLEEVEVVGPPGGDPDEGRSRVTVEMAIVNGLKLDLDFFANFEGRAMDVVSTALVVGPTVGDLGSFLGCDKRRESRKGLGYRVTITAEVTVKAHLLRKNGFVRFLQLEIALSACLFAPRLISPFSIHSNMAFPAP